jgi:hypothetical protein
MQYPPPVPGLMHTKLFGQSRERQHGDVQIGPVPPMIAFVRTVLVPHSLLAQSTFTRHALPSGSGPASTSGGPVSLPPSSTLPSSPESSGVVPSVGTTHTPPTQACPVGHAFAAPSVHVNFGTSLDTIALHPAPTIVTLARAITNRVKARIDVTGTHHPRRSPRRP